MTAVSSQAHPIHLNTSIFRGHLWKTGQKVALFAHVLFQIVSSFFTAHFKQFYWVVRNCTHFKQRPAFFVTRPPLLSEKQNFGNLFSELFAEYQKLVGISNPIRAINRELRKGFCHAEALALVQLVKAQSSSLVEQIPTLSSHASQLTLLETLEIFRHTFEHHNRDDLIQKMQSMLPEGMIAQKEAPIGCFESLLDFQGLIVTRLYSDAQCHTILLNLNPASSVYGFYDPAPNCGYYEYDSLDSFIKEMKAYVKSQGRYPQCHFSFYPYLSEKNLSGKT